MALEAKSFSYSDLPSLGEMMKPANRESTHRLILEISMPDKPEKVFTTKDKIIQIAAYSLMAVGALFLLISSGLILSGLLAGGGASLMLAESLFPIAMIALMAGVHLFNPPKDAAKVQSSLRFGPMTLSL